MITVCYYIDFLETYPSSRYILKTVGPLTERAFIREFRECLEGPNPPWRFTSVESYVHEENEVALYFSLELIGPEYVKEKLLKESS